MNSFINSDEFVFEFDPSKRESNYKKHGVDFLKAALIFRNSTVEKIDDRKNYGEDRYISIGKVDDQILVVVHTKRNNNIRIISAWKGGSKEHEKYRELIAE